MQLTRIRDRARLEFPAWRQATHVRYMLAFGVARVLPAFVAGRVNAWLYRRAGFDVGAGTSICGPLRLISGSSLQDKLVIGERVLLSTDIVINLDDQVTIGDAASISPFVRIYTGTHATGPGSRRMTSKVDSKPVVIGPGAWIRLDVTVLPGVSIGAGCVVGAGSVVTSDLEAHCYAEGNPAVKIRSLSRADG